MVIKRSHIVLLLGLLSIPHMYGAYGSCQRSNSDIFADSFTATLKFLDSPTVAACTYFFSRTIGGYAKLWIESKFFKPTLVRALLEPNEIIDSIENFHFIPKVNEKITRVVDMAKAVVKNPARLKFQNAMLYGAPGTGKTTVAKAMAKEAGLVAYVMAGGDFSKLQGKDLELIDKMLDSARKSGKKVAIIMDEMERVWGSRAEGISEAQHAILSKLFVEFEKPSNQIWLIGITNRPQDLDEGAHRRMPQQIEICVPDCAGRKEIFGLYVRSLFTQDNAYSAEQHEMLTNFFTNICLERLAHTIGDVAPAEIEDVMNRIKTHSVNDNNGIPTDAIIEMVMTEKLEQLKACQEGFTRASDKAKTVAHMA